MTTDTSETVKRALVCGDIDATVDFNLYELEPAEEVHLGELYLDALEAEGYIKGWSLTERDGDCRTFEIHARDGSSTKISGTYFVMFAGLCIEQLVRGEYGE